MIENNIEDLVKPKIEMTMNKSNASKVNNDMSFDLMTENNTKPNQKKYKQAYDYLFYDENALLERIKEIKKYGCFETNLKFPKFFILPNSKIKKFWDGLILLFCLYTIIVIPLEIGLFILIRMDNANMLFLYQVVDYIVAAFLFVDLIFHFRTGIYTEKSELISDIKIIKNKYLKGYFFWDLISILPFDIMFYSLIANSFKDILIKIPRLLRCIKLITFFLKFKHATLTKACILFFVYYLIAHYFACLLCYTESKILIIYVRLSQNREVY